MLIVYILKVPWRQSFLSLNFQWRGEPPLYHTMRTTAKQGGSIIVGIRMRHPAPYMHCPARTASLATQERNQCAVVRSVLRTRKLNRVFDGLSNSLIFCFTCVLFVTRNSYTTRLEITKWISILSVNQEQAASLVLQILKIGRIMNSIRERGVATRLLYPFHHLEIEDYWGGVYGGWRAVLAELLGTLMYVYVSAGVAIATNTYLLLTSKLYIYMFTIFFYFFLFYCFFFYLFIFLVRIRSLIIKKVRF